MTGSHQHTFGGAWTQVKLDAIADYLQFYNGAIQYKPTPARPFTRWYVDAFAGSGTRFEERASGGLLDGQPICTEMVELEGSARRALAINPPFHHLVFVEDHEGRFKALEQLKIDFPERSIRCIPGDANEGLRALFGSPPWSQQLGDRGSNRAVVFLDPYGMQVRWATLQMLASKMVDVWYLFPLGAVTRQLAHDYDAVDDDKRMALHEIFGTEEWETELYAHVERTDLFGQRVEMKRRNADKARIEAYARSRLGSLFHYVSDPLPLVTDKHGQQFSLFCLTGATNEKTVNLIKKGVAFVLKKYGLASHRMFGH